MNVSIQVDFNSVTAEGLVKASKQRANGRLFVGQSVTAHDPGHTEEYQARVVSIDEELSRVLLDVDM